MEVIINLIILLVIVASIFKRLQEIQKSGRDIQQQPRAGTNRQQTGGAGQERERTETASAEDETEWEQPKEESVFESLPDPLREAFESMMERPPREIHGEPPEVRVPGQGHGEPETVGESISMEKQPPETGREKTRLPGVSIPAPAPSGRKPRRRAVSALPVFSRQNVVQGMVMSEILGPPSAFREGPLSLKRRYPY